MEETGILEKTEQSDSCYLGLNQVRNFRNLNESEPDARPVPVKVDPVQAAVGATKWVAPSGLHSQDPSVYANGGRNLAGKPAGLGVVENGVVWDDKMLAAEPDRADSRARGGIFGTAESWELDVRCDGTSDTDPARRDTLRRAEPCSGHSRYPLERPRTRRGGQP